MDSINASSQLLTEADNTALRTIKLAGGALNSTTEANHSKLRAVPFVVVPSISHHLSYFT
jgi:hypothetical protein